MPTAQQPPPIIGDCDVRRVSKSPADERSPRTSNETGLRLAAKLARHGERRIEPPFFRAGERHREFLPEAQLIPRESGRGTGCTVSRVPASPPRRRNAISSTICAGKWKILSCPAPDDRLFCDKNLRAVDLLGEPANSSLQVNDTLNSSRTISVALCTYNGAPYLGEQLQSIAAQTRRPDEVVIFDDGSSDDTVARRAAVRRDGSFPVRVQVNPQNLGCRENFAACITACTGETIALSDQDDVWLPHKLERLTKALKEQPGAAFAFSDASLVDQSA